MPARVNLHHQVEEWSPTETLAYIRALKAAEGASLPVLFSVMHAMDFYLSGRWSEEHSTREERDVFLAEAGVIVIDLYMETGFYEQHPERFASYLNLIPYSLERTGDLDGAAEIHMLAVGQFRAYVSDRIAANASRSLASLNARRGRGAETELHYQALLQEYRDSGRPPPASTLVAAAILPHRAGHGEPEDVIHKLRHAFDEVYPRQSWESIYVARALSNAMRDAGDSHGALQVGLDVLHVWDAETRFEGASDAPPAAYFVSEAGRRDTLRLAIRDAEAAGGLEIGMALASEYAERFDRDHDQFGAASLRRFSALLRD